MGRPRLGLGGTPRCWPAPRVPPHTPLRTREQKSGAGGGLSPSSPPPQAAVYRFQEERWETQQRTYQEKRRARGHARHRGQRPSVCVVVAVGGGGSGAPLGAEVAAFAQQKLEFSMGALPKTSSQMLRLSPARPRAGTGHPQAHRTPRPGGLRSPSPWRPPGAPGAACWVPAVSASRQPPLDLRAASDCPTLWSRVASPPPATKNRCLPRQDRAGAALPALG